MDDLRCYIIVVSYNSSRYIVNCLDSILSLKNYNFNIVLVDNNSTDNTVQLVENIYHKHINNHQIVIFEQNSNLGYASALNVGINVALNSDKCKYIWALNSDIVVSSNSLDLLIHNVSDNNIISPGLYDYNNRGIVQSLGCSINKYLLTTCNIKKHNQNIDFLSGASLFFNKKIINKIGLFSEKYFMYYEDVEWCTRAIKKDIKLEIVKDCFVYHRSKISLSIELKFISLINRLKYSIDHYFYLFPLVLIGVVLSNFKIFFNKSFHGKYN